MTCGIVEVEVEYAGKSRNTIHAFRYVDGFPDDGSLSTATLNGLGFAALSEAASDGRTDPSSGTFGPSNFLEAIIAFHRKMQHASCQIKGVYVREVPFTNGANSQGKAKRLNLTCRGLHIGVPEDDMENANVALQISKTTGAVGSDDGMLMLRGALTKESTVADGNDGVLLQDANVAIYQTALLGALNDGGAGVALGNFFYADPGSTGTDDTIYGVINTVESATLTTRGGNPKRVFSSFQNVVGMEVIDATSRDARRRGRKRTTGGTGEV